MGLAATYLKLDTASLDSSTVADESVRRRVFGKIAEEHHRTITMHRLITANDDLLADNPSLILRNQVDADYVEKT